MGQALCGLEYEQGATPSGGHPTWYRFGMCDTTTGMLSSLAVLQALYHRDRTGEGQAIDVDILSAAMFLASDTFIGPPSLPTRPHLDMQQTGLGPLHRLYRTADGWICVVVRTEEHWRNLCAAVGAPALATNPRFSTPDVRRGHAVELADELGARFQTATAAAWFAELDRQGVPCEISSETWQRDWYDDPDSVANQWVTDYHHPVWGKLEQAGRLFELAGTPGRVAGPPPIIGEHSREILAELGYSADDVAALHDTGVIGW
jgi:crotonobetainyl-CoA:carnitine CoA-transferase CaiB-like acyl-CoA transferase